MDEKNKDVKQSEPLDANSSATSELAALLSVEQEINAADIQEEPVELAAETADGSISWAVVVPAMALVVAVVAWGLGAPDNFESAASASCPAQSAPICRSSSRWPGARPNPPTAPRSRWSLLATFFITSADSASTVMASISQGGRSTPSPWLSGVWGLLTAAIGLTLLVSGGDSALGNIQSVTIVAATPFLFVVVALMFALVKDLRNDVVYLDQRSQEAFQRQLAIERRHRREREEEKRLNRALRQAMGRRGPRERVRCAGTERKRK